MLEIFKKTKLIILLLIMVGSLLFVGTIFAQDLGFGSVDSVAGISGYETGNSNMTFLNTTIADGINIFLGLIGVVFVGLAIYSGYQWMTAGGEEDKVKTAQDRLRNATIGVVIVLLAFIGTRTVFTFFYQQAGDRAGSYTQSPTRCDSNIDCEAALGFGYICIADHTCQPGGEPDGRRCEYNTDCPPDQPICERIGNISDDTSGWVNFQGWSFCTCKPENCKAPRPFCIDVSGVGSACRECETDGNCARGSYCGDFTCQLCAGLPEKKVDFTDFRDTCADHSSRCSWDDAKRICK